MQIEIEHPAFKTRRLAVQSAGFIRAPRLLVDGSAVKLHRGRYTVPSDAGVEISIELKYNFFDPVPKMKIADESIQLARPFEWYEYGWFVFLVLSLYKVTPIGGLVGAVAAVVSARVFRGNSNAAKKIGLLVAVTIGAVAALVVVEILLRLFGATT